MEIEQNIPVPARRYPGRRQVGLGRVAGKMQPGDSVAVHSYAHAITIATVLRNRGLHATIRSIPGGARVWCLSEKTEE